MKKQEKYSKIICEFLKQRPCLSILYIEKSVGMPQSYLNKFVKNQIFKIPEKYIFELLFFLADYGIQVEGYYLSADKDTGNIFFLKYEQKHTIEVLFLNDGTKVNRIVTDDMSRPDYTDEYDGKVSIYSYKILVEQFNSMVENYSQLP